MFESSQPTPARPRRFAVEQIVSALALITMLVMLGLSFAGWVVVALFSAAVIAVVCQTFRAFAFVVTTAERPDISEAALRDMLRPRRMWSPFPVVRVEVIESVRGSNLHVHQRPRLFWFIVMLLTALASITVHIYLAILSVEVASVIAGLWYARWLIYRAENA